MVHFSESAFMYGSNCSCLEMRWCCRSRHAREECATAADHAGMQSCAYVHQVDYFDVLLSCARAKVKPHRHPATQVSQQSPALGVGGGKRQDLQRLQDHTLANRLESTVQSILWQGNYDALLYRA
eukprot:6195180-Pleurochrysis_carterae.AAC.1